LHKLGNTLKSANNHYNHAVKGLAGQQGLHGKVERFRQLSSKASKSMSELEPIHSDIEIERLEAMELTEPEPEPAENNPLHEPVALEVVSSTDAEA
jgi:DNA recombination protein RmuC